MSDPRIQPMSYITDGKRLCEVVRVESRRNAGLGASPIATVTIEDCSSGVRSSMTEATVLKAWQLVRAAPSCPEALETAA